MLTVINAKVQAHSSPNLPRLINVLLQLIKLPMRHQIINDKNRQIKSTPLGCFKKFRLYHVHLCSDLWGKSVVYTYDELWSSEKRGAWRGMELK